MRGLSLQHRSEGISSALSKVRWLQGLQQRDCLKHLQSAHLLLSVPREEPNPLAQGFMMLAGSCCLRHCTLNGSFCLATALGLLPTSLFSLGLWPNFGPQVIRLSAFKRFTALKVLRLNVYAVDEQDTNEPGFGYFQFLIDAPFPRLKSLNVTMAWQLADGCDIHECLPNANQVICAVMRDHQGVQLAESVLLLARLQKLDMALIDGEGPLDFTLVIHEASSIEELTIEGSPRSGVSVVVGKYGISFDCRNVNTLTVRRPENLEVELYDNE